MFRALEKICVVVATGFGLGYILPIGQGTLAVFFALFWVKLFLKVSLLDQSLILLVFMVLGVLVSSVAEKKMGSKDDHKIIIDEVVSVFLTFLGMEAGISWWVLATGFILNRFFDWLKPFGIYKIQQLNRGWGIMLDDFASALLANLVLKLIFWL